MIILAIDTAGADCAVALYDVERDVVLGEVTETIGRGHAEKLMAVLDSALDAAGVSLDEVDRIAVTVGPGSFTGIRVGVAAARGLALALNVEAVGVSTLQVLAADCLATRPATEKRPVIASMDARRGEVYFQPFSSEGRPVEPPSVLPLDEARSVVAEFDAEIIGSAAALLAGGEAATGTDRFPVAVVARLAVAAPPGKPKPLYLRGPDAKPQTGFAVERM